MSGYRIIDPALCDMVPLKALSILLQELSYGIIKVLYF